MKNEKQIYTGDEIKGVVDYGSLVFHSPLQDV